MPKSTLRTRTVRLASSLPKGSKERRDLLEVLAASRIASRYLKDAGIMFEVLLDANEAKLVQVMLDAWGSRLATKAKLSGNKLTFPGRAGRASTEQSLLEKGVRAMHALGWSNGIIQDLADKITLASGDTEADHGGYRDLLGDH